LLRAQPWRSSIQQWQQRTLLGTQKQVFGGTKQAGRRGLARIGRAGPNRKGAGYLAPLKPTLSPGLAGPFRSA
jgi:hypothetical protein